jgi:excisionase family DNA binding protein
MYKQRRLNVRETASRLEVHENTVRNWEERGLIRAVRLPGSGYRRFDLAEVERLRADMLNGLAPAVEGPVIRPTGPRRIVHGDEG